MPLDPTAPDPTSPDSTALDPTAPGTRDGGGEPIIRPAVETDLPALNALYDHYIANTVATFDLEPWTAAQRAEWFTHYGRTGPHRVLVAVAGDGEPGNPLAGAAWSSAFRPKAAYDSTVETSVYVAPGWEGRRLGSRLYDELFTALAEEPVHRAIAVITTPNEGSVALHRRFGFEEVGTLTQVGLKFGRWLDVLYMQKDLSS